MIDPVLRPGGVGDRRQGLLHERLEGPGQRIRRVAEQGRCVSKDRQGEGDRERPIGSRFRFHGLQVSGEKRVRPSDVLASCLCGNAAFTELLQRIDGGVTQIDSGRGRLRST